MPVTVLTGFLGAGKTTLLNRILRAAREPIAVIVNEFGSVGVDGALVESSSEELVELNNGCVCCTVRGDLQRSLHELARRRSRRLFRKRFSRVLVETSGLAAPGPIVQTLRADEQLAESYRPAGVVCLVHAALGAEQLEKHPEARAQVAQADWVVVNQVERAQAGEAERLAGLLRHRLPLCEVRIAPPGGIAPEELLECRVGDSKPMSFVPWPSGAVSFAEPSGPWEHGKEVVTVALECTEPLDRSSLAMWLRFALSRRTEEVWRLKGVLRFRGEAHRVVLQGVGPFLEWTQDASAAPSQSVLVAIGKDLDLATWRRGWERLCPLGAQ